LITATAICVKGVLKRLGNPSEDLVDLRVVKAQRRRPQA